MSGVQSEEDLCAHDKLLFGENYELLSDWVEEAKHGAAQSRVHDPKYRDQHIRVYRELQVPHPPVLGNMSPSFQEAAQALNEREREVALLLEAVTPPPSKSQPQFVDINLSA